MKVKDLTRPDKLLLQGFKTLSSFGQNLYASKKSLAKAKAELTFIGEKKMEEVQSQLYVFDQTSYSTENQPSDFNFTKVYAEDKNYWLNFYGIHDVGIIRKIGEFAGLDRLTVRQILDTTLRPKVEEYENYLFFSVKSIAKKELAELKAEQLSFVLGAHYIISFQEEVGDHFEGIRNKLDEGLGLVRKKKCDFLFGQFLDAILDNYFETIDQINKEIAIIERDVLKNPDKSTLILLEAHKRSAQTIKKSLGPFKDGLFSIINGRTGLIKKVNLKYFKDLANSATAAIEEIDATLKTLEGLTNIYFASLSQKMNETMKVLTTVATIFIPLTFIAGIYGMNFDNMPELRHKYGYFITWGVMLIIAIGMLIYFRRKKWV